MQTKGILIIFKALMQSILDSMKEMEKSSDLDADGIPLSDEYDKQGYVLAVLRDVCKNLEEYEK